MKRKRLEILKENRLKQKDLRQKEAEEERLEKPNLSAFSNIKESIVKTGRNIFGSVLKIVGLLMVVLGYLKILIILKIQLKKQ